MTEFDQLRLVKLALDGATAIQIWTLARKFTADDLREYRVKLNYVMNITGAALRELEEGGTHDSESW